jgi:O-methyltransferase involved in polyketide biosynthesis
MAEKIHFTKEKETLLITLYAKALDSRSKNSILNDKAADALLSAIDYDFEKFRNFGSEIIVIRARQFDDWVRAFIGNHRDAVILYLGCGLDTRITRINPPATIQWFDLDYPEVISLRKKFYSARTGYEMVASSVTDLTWLKQIPDEKPILIIAEGLFEYLPSEEVRKILHAITDHFSHGELIFDVMNSNAVKSGNERLKDTTGAVLKWTVDNVDEVDQLNPELKRVTELPLFKSSYLRKLPFALRLSLKVMSVIPAFKNMMRLMKYRF